VTIHAGTVLGSGCAIEDQAVLGKHTRLSSRSAAPRLAPEPLVIGAGAAVCTGAVVFAGAQIGREAIVGDQAHVRERAVLGAETVVGRGSAVDNDVRIGARVRMNTLVYVTAFSVVEDDVFLGPGVLTTNDNTMARHPVGQRHEGAVLRRACRIGAGAVLLPGVEVGEEALVAAGAVVTRDVPARAVVIGSPARVVREVTDDELIERWR
jgi:UDP-2-acetamido-3-amino-2,3-dideoxy-glucuronate N-acetyltransferase